MLVETPCHAPRPNPGEAPNDPLRTGARSPRAAPSANTERAVRSDLAIYRSWCRERGVSAVPAHPKTIAAFIDAMARVRAPATVRRYVASIAGAHRAAGATRATKSDPVRRALARMHRRRGRRQSQAEGLTGALRERLLSASGEALIDVRNRALLAVAYDTLLRRSELVALQVSDLVKRLRWRGDGAGAPLQDRPRGPGGDGLSRPRHRGAAQRVARTKRGAPGPGLSLPVTRRGGRGAGGRPGLSHLQAHGPRGEPAPRGGPGDLRAQHPGGGHPGHGRGGIAMAAIVHAGRWKSTAMVNRYGERLLARRSGAAQLARLQHRA